MALLSFSSLTSYDYFFSRTLSTIFLPFFLFTDFSFPPSKQSLKTLIHFPPRFGIEPWTTSSKASDFKYPLLSSFYSPSLSKLTEAYYLPPLVMPVTCNSAPVHFALCVMCRCRDVLFRSFS